MSCDIMEVANAHVSGGGEALAAAVRRLAGCLDTRPEALPCDDKRPAGEIFGVICISLASRCIPHIRTSQGGQMEPENLVFRHFVPIKTLPFPFFAEILGHCVLSDETQRHALLCYQTEEMKMFNI